jgi:hypothetical protein
LNCTALHREKEEQLIWAFVHTISVESISGLEVTARSQTPHVGTDVSYLHSSPCFEFSRAIRSHGRANRTFRNGLRSSTIKPLLVFCFLASGSSELLTFTIRVALENQNAYHFVTTLRTAACRGCWLKFRHNTRRVLLSWFLRHIRLDKYKPAHLFGLRINQKQRGTESAPG